MKKGKSVKLNLSNSFKSVYGTVDSKNLKSVYINIQAWVSPKEESENWNRIVCNLSREIKHSVFNSIDTEIFKEQSIVDLDLRTSGISSGKKSFFNLEVNLYTSEEIDFKSEKLKNEIKKIIKNIYTNNIEKNEIRNEWNHNYINYTINVKNRNTEYSIDQTIGNIKNNFSELNSSFFNTKYKIFRKIFYI